MKKNKLKYLDLSCNNLTTIATSSSKAFFDNNKKISVIDLSHNKLQSGEVMLIAEELATCSSLECLSLSHNDINRDATDNLCKMASQLFLQKLISIDIYGNPLSQTDINKVSYAAGFKECILL